MILVTVGTNEWDFPRLIKEMDLISKNINEDVLIQTGHTNFKPKYARSFKFNQKNEMEDLYQKARVVISHAGVGSIILALKNKKNIIVVPRMESYKENFDNHQVELAEILEKNGVIVVWDINNIKKVLNQVKNIGFKSSKNEMIQSLRAYLAELAH